jgi:hypothetical protein
VDADRIVSNLILSSYAVVCDHGQGGLWAIIEAESAEKIRGRFPQIEVFDAPPPTLSAEAVARIRAQGVQSIDSHAMKGWLADLEP